jgi:hypothetical protein
VEGSCEEPFHDPERPREVEQTTSCRPGPELRFEEQRLISFSGLAIFQALFQRLRFKDRLATAMADVRMGISSERDRTQHPREHA